MDRDQPEPGGQAGRRHPSRARGAHRRALQRRSRRRSGARDATSSSSASSTASRRSVAARGVRRGARARRRSRRRFPDPGSRALRAATTAPIRRRSWCTASPTGWPMCSGSRSRGKTAHRRARAASRPRRSSRSIRWRGLGLDGAAGALRGDRIERRRRAAQADHPSPDAGAQSLRVLRARAPARRRRCWSSGGPGPAGPTRRRGC